LVGAAKQISGVAKFGVTTISKHRFLINESIL
jgi:hypothetical protein